MNIEKIDFGEMHRVTTHQNRALEIAKTYCKKGWEVLWEEDQGDRITIYFVPGSEKDERKRNY